MGLNEIIGNGSYPSSGATSDFLALRGSWLPKLVPSTDQANINKAGNRAVFLWSSVPGDPFSLGNIFSLL